MDSSGKRLIQEKASELFKEAFIKVGNDVVQQQLRELAFEGARYSIQNPFVALVVGTSFRSGSVSNILP